MMNKKVIEAKSLFVCDKATQNSISLEPWLINTFLYDFLKNFYLLFLVTAFNINIPDKQKKKNAESTIRIYRNFFSITNKNFKCINRWYTKDIKSFSKQEDSQFMFEICPQHKTKGLLVNIVTPNANELLGAFEEIRADQEEPGGILFSFGLLCVFSFSSLENIDY